MKGDKPSPSAFNLRPCHSEPLPNFHWEIRGNDRGEASEQGLPAAACRRLPAGRQGRRAGRTR